LARAVLPEGKGLKDISRAQEQVLAELGKLADLVVNPDTVQTRLQPRLSRLEDLYVPAYLDELMALDAIQSELEEAVQAEGEGDAARVLNALAALPEAKRIAEQLRETLSGIPPRLRKSPEDRDIAQRDVCDSGAVRERLENSPITFRRLVEERAAREQALLVGVNYLGLPATIILAGIGGGRLR